MLIPTLRNFVFWWSWPTPWKASRHDFFSKKQQNKCAAQTISICILRVKLPHSADEERKLAVYLLSFFTEKGNLLNFETIQCIGINLSVSSLGILILVMATRVLCWQTVSTHFSGLDACLFLKNWSKQKFSSEALYHFNLRKKFISVFDNEKNEICFL